MNLCIMTSAGSALVRPIWDAEEIRVLDELAFAVPSRDMDREYLDVETRLDAEAESERSELLLERERALVYRERRHALRLVYRGRGFRNRGRQPRPRWARDAA